MAMLKNFLEFQYEEVEVLSRKKKIYLVKDKISSRIFVKRELRLSMAEIYEKLKCVCHQNLVRIVEVYTIEDVCIVIEEYVNGMSIGQLLETEGMFPEDVSVRYFRALLEALKALHDVGLVHRDVSASNIRITTDGVLKLMDFDVARQVRGDGNADTVLMGTPDTAAPEQYGFSESDNRTDIFAAGVLLNQMLTGSLPVRQRYTGTKKIAKIIDRCIWLDKNNRYDCVEQVIRELDQTYGFYAQKLYDMLPGLRTEKWYNKLAVCCGYLAFWSYFLILLDAETCNAHKWTDWIMPLVSLIVQFCIPVALISNVGQYDIRLLKMSYIPLWGRRVCRLILGGLVFCIGCVAFPYYE